MKEFMDTRKQHEWAKIAKEMNNYKQLQRIFLNNDLLMTIKCRLNMWSHG